MVACFSPQRFASTALSPCSDDRNRSNEPRFPRTEQPSRLILECRPLAWTKSKNGQDSESIAAGPRDHKESFQPKTSALHQASIWTLALTRTVLKTSRTTPPFSTPHGPRRIRERPQNVPRWLQQQPSPD